MGSNKRVVLAYSGGLDTSVIVPWLKENYGAEVICMAGDVGQQGGLEGLEQKAIATGASAFFGEDLRADFVEQYVWPTLKIGAVYGRKYLLGTAMARPILGQRQVQIAREVSPGAVDVASGLNIGAFNLGIAGGAWAGGLVVEGIGLAAAPYIAAGVVAVGIVMVRLSGRLNAATPQAVAAE